MGWYYVAHWYPTYVIGVAAGMLSKSGKLGYVGSFPVPSVYSGTNAFLMGARTVNPKATLQVIMINSWFDPQGANQAGTALVDNGCDFLFGIMDEAAYLQVAEKRGVWAAMWNTDMRRYGPKSYVSSLILDWKPFYVDQVRKRLAGEWTPTGNLLPMGGGIDRDAWGENVPKEVAEAADAVRDEDPRRLQSLRRRDQGRERRGPRQGRRDDGRDDALQLGLVDRGRLRHQRLSVEPRPAGVCRRWTAHEHQDGPELAPGTPPIVLLKGITKAFPGVIANADIDLDVRPGEIHALLGENGAGKSTLDERAHRHLPAGCR